MNPCQSIEVVPNVGPTPVNVKLGQTFREADADGSGRVDRAEFGRLCRRLDVEMGATEVEGALAACDANRDGAVDLAEFRAWWGSEAAAALRERHRAAGGGSGVEVEFGRTVVSEAGYRKSEQIWYAADGRWCNATLRPNPRWSGTSTRSR